MMNRRVLLEKGLTVISACKRRTGDVWEAHFGAAAIAAYFFIAENECAEELGETIAAQADTMVSRHLDVGCDDGVNRAADRPAPAMDARAAEQAIATSLEATIDGLYWVGHNAIYAALAMKAIRELGGWGTEADIGGIAELIRTFEGKIPGRSWIGYKTSEVKALSVSQDWVGYGPIESGADLSRLALRELGMFETLYRAEAHHDLIGHMLTFSHALVSLEELGYADLFERGLTPLLKLVVVLRASRDLRPGDPLRLASPVDREPLAIALPADALPTERAYWSPARSRHEWDFGHAFKFPYGFYHHVARAGGADAAAFLNFRRVLGP